MGLDPIPNDRLGLDSNVAGSEAPLWYYVLAEAASEAQGRHLGPVGGRIVAEVFVGLARNDPNSFLNLDPKWTPRTAFGDERPLVAYEGRFELAHLLRAAGVDRDPFPGAA